MDSQAEELDLSQLSVLPLKSSLKRKVYGA